MKIFKKLLGFLGKIVAVLLILTLLPYAARFMSSLFPESSQNVLVSAQIVSQKLEEAQLLTTMEVKTTGKLHITDSVVLLGEVQNVDLVYEYTGGFGIDLSKLYLSMSGNDLRIEIPPFQAVNGGMRVLSETDSFFQLKSMSASRRQEKLDEEQKRLEEIYMKSEELKTNTEKVLREKITGILEIAGKKVNLQVVFPEN